MAVTINDMQVDVDKRAAATDTAPKPQAAEKPDRRREMALHVERERRLKAD